MKLAGRIYTAVYRAVSNVLIAAAALVLLLLVFGVRPYAVTTGSMEPTIPEGGVCFVDQRARFDKVSEGDIIVFRLGELLVTHRAVRIDGGGITTKGDANNTEDLSGKVTEANFVGRVVFWVPLVGRVLIFAHTVTGRIVVIGAFVLFAAGGFLCDRMTPDEEEKEN